VCVEGEEDAVKVESVMWALCDEERVRSLGPFGSRKWRETVWGVRQYFGVSFSRELSARANGGGEKDVRSGTGVVCVIVWLLRLMIRYSHTAYAAKMKGVLQGF
jgi:hypothetical protein